MKFKATIIVLLVATAGWFGWWWLAAQGQKAALNAWLDERREAGWQAEALSIDVGGFPNRVDADLTEIALADPGSGWAWNAPRLAIYQIIYKPTEAIVIWPEEQRIAAPGARATLRSELMRASFSFETTEALTLERNSFEVRNGAIAADAGWTAGVDYYNHHIRPSTGDIGPNAYEFVAEATNLRLPDFIRRTIDPSNALPPAIEAIRIEGAAAFDTPLDRHAFERVKPQLTALTLLPSEGVWGDLALRMSGAITADSSGYAEGSFSISAKNWEDMLDAAVISGAINKSLSDALKLGLGFVARLSGGRNTLDVALTFEAGYTKIGPVPLGPAPRLLR